MALSWSFRPRNMTLGILTFVNSGGTRPLAKKKIVESIQAEPLLAHQGSQALGEKLWTGEIAPAL